jgi:LysR family transcriptional regulator, mexEF-oprN operon transcriptional activator
VAIGMLWHASYDDDPAHRWLRDLLRRLAGEGRPLPEAGEGRPLPDVGEGRPFPDAGEAPAVS